MGYTPPKKKKNWWEEAADNVGSFFRDTGRNVAKAADAVIPGDQSSWHREQPTRTTSSRPRPEEPIRIARPKPTVVATFDNKQPESIASLEQNNVQGIDFNGRDNGLKVRTALPDQQIVKVVQPNQQQELTVAQPTTQPNIQIKKDPHNAAIDQGLDQGKSWENISKETGIDLPTVKARSQATRPNYGIKTNTYVDYRMTDPQNKKVFGVDVSGMLGDYGQTYTMKVDQTANLTEQDFLKGFDYIGKEGKARGEQVQNMYVNKLREMAEKGDQNAKYTLATLQRNGKLKGDWTDVIESANQEFLGGLNRSAARTIEMLPGEQGTGKWADNQEKIWAGASDMDKIGKTVGQVERVGLDIGTMIVPAGVVDKAVKGTKAVQGITNFNRGAGFVARTLPGSAVATGIDTFSQASQGNDQDLARSAAIGTGVDLALPLAGKVVSRIPGVNQAIDNAGQAVSKLFSNSQTTSGVQSLVQGVVDEVDPNVIRQAFGVSEEVATQLAQETDKQVVAQTLRELSVDPSLNISPEMRKRMQDEGITEVNVGDSPYGAHYDRNGRITVTGQDAASDDNLYHEIGHAVWQKRLTPQERAAFAQINGRAAQEARGRAGYSADDIANEDFSDFTRLALTGRLNEVPESVRGIVAKYAGVTEQAIKETDPITHLSMKAKNSLQNDTTGIKPNGVERSGGFVENGTAKPIEFRRLPDGSVVIVDGRHTLEYVRKQGITDYPMTDVTAQYEVKAPAVARDNATEVKQRYGNNLGLDTDPRARFANRQLEAQTPAAEIAAKYGGKVEDIQRNIDRYGEDVTRNMYASKSDSPTVKNIDAVASSELRKQFGKARVQNAPEAPASPAQVPVVRTDPETGEKFVAFEKPIVEKVDPNVSTGNKIQEMTDAEERSLQNKQIEEQRIQDYKDRNSYLTDTQERDLATQTLNTPLGRMVEGFYAKNEGNTDIAFRDIERVGRWVAAEIDRAFKQAGSDFATVARKVEEARRNGANSLDEVDLTPAEKQLWRGAQSEMDYVRQRAEANGRDIGEGNYGEMYLPNRDIDRLETPDTLYQDFKQTMPGNEIKRTNAIDLDRLNYSPDVVAGYITRYADEKLVKEQRAKNALTKTVPDAPDEVVTNAAKEVVKLQDELNRQVTKIGLGGAGKRVTVTDGEVIDFADRMSSIGKQVGQTQIPIKTTPKGLTNGDRINSVDITYNGEVHPVGDFLGLNQIRDAAGYAGTQFAEAGGDKNVLADLVKERLTNDYRIPADDIEYLVESIRRAPNDDALIKSRVISVYKSAGKQQLMDNLMKVDIQNKQLRKDVSELSKQILREGTTEQALSTKLTRNTLRATNALFRKLNVSSALNEMSDLTSFFAVYGKDLKVATPDFSLINKYGVGEIDAAIEPYLRQIEQSGSKGQIRKVLGQVNDATRLYKLVETYKAGVFLKTAEEVNYAKGLRGDELTAKVLDDYRRLALPVDMFTKTFLDDYPLWTQYLTWGARNLEKEGKLLAGHIDAGVMADKNQAQRIARNLYANIPAKTAFWLASNGLKGTAIMTAFGLTDFTGLTSQDYSGIQEDDKSFFDRTTQFTNISTTASILNTLIQDWEKEQLKNSDKYKNADYNPYENTNLADSFSKQFTPQFIKNAAGSYSFSEGEMKGGAAQLMKDGYSESAGGRIQYEAPTDPWNIFKAYAFGKNQTANAREYSGRENLVDRMNEGVNPLTAVKDMAAEQIGLQKTDYNRPLTDDYSERYKAIDREARTALLEGGRQYNDYLDNLQKNEPEAYNNYIEAMDGDHVNPEFWRSVTADRKTFEMMRDRKKQLNKDLGTPYDPIYDLPDDQANAVLKYKSSPTGDDIALRNMLNKEQWYKDFKDRTKEFYDKNPKEGSDFTQTQRVQEWNALDDKLSSFFFDKDAKEAPAWSNDFPLVYQQKAINAKFGFDSPESKAFFKANYDAYAAQKEGYDKAQLDVINAMRKIEGYPEMSWEAYQQATEIADTDTSDDKKNGWKNYGRGGGGGYIDANGGSFGQRRAIDLDTVKVKVPKVSVKRKGGTPGKITVKKGGKLL